MIDFKTDGNKLICIPEVEIIASNVPTMRDALLEKLDADQSWDELVFDCDKIETIDSIGINLIVGLLKKTGSADKAFKVIGCNEPILKVFKLFRLDEQFTVEGK